MESLKSEDSTIQNIAPGISFGAKSQTVIEVTKFDVEPDTKPYYVPQTIHPWAIWGYDNYHPQLVVDENMQEPYSAAALRFKRSAHWGKGLYLYKEGVDEDGNQTKQWLPKSQWPQEIKDFWWQNDIDNFAQGIIADFEWWNRYHVQYIPNKLGNKIVQVKWQRCVDTRTKKRNPVTGEMEGYFLSRQWWLLNPTDYVEIPAFDRFNPFSKPNAIYEHRLHSVDKDYYVVPEWHSNVRILQLAKKIPQWILSNIDNSINIKYHVRIPQEYFENLFPIERYKDDVNAQQAAMLAYELTVKQNIDNMLTGAENAGKIFYSKIAIDKDPSSPNYGKPIPGWEIVQVPNDIKDTAWMAAYGSMAAAMCTAHGMPPSLAGIIIPQSGASSGSNVREEFNYYNQLNVTQPQQTTLEWFEFVKRFNKWPEDICAGYREIVLQSLDQNKSGYAVGNEQKPTSVNKGNSPNSTKPEDDGTD